MLPKTCEYLLMCNGHLELSPLSISASLNNSGFSVVKQFRYQLNQAIITYKDTHKNSFSQVSNLTLCAVCSNYAVWPRLPAPSATQQTSHQLSSPVRSSGNNWVAQFAQFPVTMLTVALSCILLGAVIVYLRLRAKYRPMMMLSERIPGPKLLPVVGNALYFGLKTEG